LALAALVATLLAAAFQFGTSGIPSTAVVVAHVDDLQPRTPLNWSNRVWVILDGYGEVHAFPTTYRVNGTRWAPVAWLSPSEEIAAMWLDRDPCARFAGDGIFYVYSPSGSRYDATGRRLLGADRPRLDWYSVDLGPDGSISVDLREVHRASWSDRDGANTSTPTPGPRAASGGAGCR